MRRLQTTLVVLGDLLVTAGAIVALFAVYELSFTDVTNAREQSALRTTVQRQWSKPPVSPTPTPTAATSAPPSRPPARGSSLAVLRIPRLGRDYNRVVVEGVGFDELAKGPGHYPGTALPGQVGNFVVSGHRTTHGAPFNRLDELRVGDPIVVETQRGWLIYDVTSTKVVQPTAVEVVAPVPGHPGQRPRAALLTFTTCHPKYSARQRLVVFGALVSTRFRAAGPPPVLAG